MLDNSLYLSRIRVVGEKKCDYTLRNGVNIFKGSNSTGKTTLLRFFDFAFGSKSKRFIDVVENNCDFVIVDVVINGKNYTIKRGITNKDDIYVYEGHFDTVPELMTQKSILYSWLKSEQKECIGNFYLTNLRIKPREISVSARKGAEFSWRNLLDLVYIGQNEWAGFQAADKLQPLMKKAVFEVFLGFDNENLDYQEKRLRNLNKDLVNYKLQKKVVKDFLDGSDRQTGSETNLNQLNSEIALYEKEKVQMLKTLQLKRESNALLEDKQKMERHLIETRDNIQELTGKFEEIQMLLNKTDVDLEKNRLQLKAKMVFSQLPITKCPNCFKSLPIKGEGQCTVCGQDYAVNDSEVDYAQNLFLLMDDRKELTQVIENAQQDLKALAERKTNLETSLNSLSSQIDQINKDVVSPVVKELEIINSKLIQLNKSLGEAGKVNSYLKQESQISRNIISSNQQIDELTKSITELTDNRPEVVEVKGRFLELLGRIFSEFNVNLKLVDLNERYEPLFAENEDIRPGLADVNKSKGGKIILGYYTAVLEYSLKYSSPYPKLLILDTPRQDELDMTVFSKIIAYWKNLSSYKKPYQIIIAGSEFPSNCDCILDDYHNQEESDDYSKPNRFSVN